MSEILEVAKRARTAALKLQIVPTEEKNAALQKVWETLTADRDVILAANARDKANAAKMMEEGKLSSANYKRLELGGDKYADVMQV